ncbi:hypothetical protein [Asinibacterium sp. OR53]|uniref:hypothetical protein n=1 Tax=Asinibacterium sp. OR53 TaxID=925409 RepID=UPI00047E4A15|nr:hypothetical protein [Asinibacterium sp. OR53]
MKNKISYSIETLLFGIENPKGAIEQVLFANKMAEHEGMPHCNRLAKLTFTDLTVNRALPGAVPLDETLILGYEGWSDSTLHLCIRSGRSACKIATGSFPNREIEIYDDYRHAILLRKLSDKDIKEIFNHVWDNMELIQPNPNPIREDW